MLPSVLKDNLRLPVIASPLFIISHPQLTLAQCKAGVIGAFPALNARPESQLDEWLAMITEELAAHNSANPDRPAAPLRSTRSCTCPIADWNMISASASNIRCRW